jgi:radial spoke head protein 9
MYVTDAAGNYVAKPGFFVRYPDQLSSYVAPTGNLGKAAPGTWCVYFYLFIFPIYLLLVWASRLISLPNRGLVWDSFKRVATLRSFAYPGFFAYYSSASNTAGNLYFGNGLRNEEVGFV